MDESVDEGLLWKAVEAEMEGICCWFHGGWEVVDEMCFLIAEYRVKVLGWAGKESEGAMTAEEAMEVEALLLEELIEAEIVADLERKVVLEASKGDAYSSLGGDMTGIGMVVDAHVDDAGSHGFDDTLTQTGNSEHPSTPTAIS